MNATTRSNGHTPQNDIIIINSDGCLKHPRI